MEVIVTTSYQGALRAPQSSSFAFVLAATLTAAIRKVGQVLKNRHDATMLAGMDERMLADIGLTRSDLHDAFAEPIWNDPTAILASRAGERRKHRAQLTVNLASPPLVPQVGFTVPNTSRPARYTV
jgi:uncharacterized protein YjiS (DUF1127 family)